jgi:hypothetical protein
MIKIVDKYATSKTKLMSCCRTTMTAIIIFSFLLGLSMVGTTSVAAGSISGSQIGGMQELQEEEQQIPETGGGDSGITGDTDANTITGIVGGNNTNLYENAEYGIQIRYPQDWVHVQREAPLPFDFGVGFMSLRDAFEFGRAQESGATSETPAGVAGLIGEPLFGITDQRQLEEFISMGATSQGYKIISTNPNAILSGMPAFEVVFVEPENRTKQLQVWSIQGDRMYNVGYVSHESIFEQSLPIVQDMISSFTITNDTRSTTATTLTENNGNTTTAPGLNTSTTAQFQTPSESPSTTTSPTTADGNNQTTSLEAARQQYLAVWNQTEFQIAFNTYIEPGSATGYGIYEERRGGNIFRPGETIQLYAEPVGFGHQQILDENGNILYLTNLTADIIMFDANGNELASFGGPLIDFLSHRQNTDMQLILTVTQDESFPVGDYMITYIVYDQVKGESFQIDKSITIAADDGDDAGAATIQEEQQQQQQPQEAEWLPYENATYGVRMLYPSDWIQEAGTQIDDRFVVVSNFFSPEETDWAYVFIAIDNMPTNLESSLNDTINGYSQEPSFRDFQILSISMNNFTLAGMHAYTLEATYTDAELGPQQLLAVETIVGGKGYGIQYIASPQTYQQYFPIAERMIELFEISQQLQQQQEEEEQQPQQNQEDSFSAIPGLF